MWIISTIAGIIAATIAAKIYMVLVPYSFLAAGGMGLLVGTVWALVFFWCMENNYKAKQRR